MSNNTFYTELSIPAYNRSGNGLVVTVFLKAITRKRLVIKAQGRVASALKPALRRAIEILTTINPAWEKLCSLEYTLISDHALWVVKDTRSAGLPLSIGLLNLYRQYQQKIPCNHLIGTGILRVDGTFESTHKEDIKRQSIKNTQHKTLITSSLCDHVFELDQCMEQLQYQQGEK